MSLHEREAPPLAGECASGALFLALPVKNGPLPAELKVRENTASYAGYWFFSWLLALNENL